MHFLFSWETRITVDRLNLLFNMSEVTVTYENVLCEVLAILVLRQVSAGW